MSNAQPDAGYYPDPAGSGHRRYWDGQRWTDHLMPGAAPVQSVTAARLAALQPVRPAVRTVMQTAILPDTVPATIVRKRPPPRISRIAFGVFIVVGTTVATYVNTQPLGPTASPAAVHATR